MTISPILKNNFTGRDLALAHPATFLSAYGIIQDPSDVSRGPFKWELWPWQWELLDLMVSAQRCIICKARQLGVSWLMAGYALWTILAKPGAVVLMISKGKWEAAQLKNKVVFLYDHLPPSMKVPSHPDDRDSDTQFVLGAIGSKVVSLPDSPGAGRSETATLVIVDEWAYQEYAADIYGAVEPTLGFHGQAIGVSTASGPSGTFHDIYMAAKKGEGEFVSVFLPYHLRPGRDEAWRAKEDAKFKAAGTPEKTASEYPRTDLEAFQSSINSFFSLDLQQMLLATVESPITEEDEGMLRIYRAPVLYRNYSIGADVARGISGGNYSTAAVIDTATGLVAATFRGLIPPDLFAQPLDRLGRYYHDAMLAVESNNHGILTLHTLKNNLHYPHLYHRQRGDSVKNPSWEAGWQTNAATKPQMLIGLRGALLSGDLTSLDSWFAEEAQYFRQSGVEPGPVDYNAAHGHTDDMVIAYGVANAARRMAGGQWRGVRTSPALSR